MAIINIASGKSINRTAAEVADVNNSFVGVAGGGAETLIVQMQANEALLLANQTARFTNVAIKVNGSAGNDVFTGAENADTVLGLAGNDNLSGNGGNDNLDGGAGNDTLDGGAGNDKMTGGAGNDTYVVDSTTDKVLEAANGGTDTVSASVNYVLGTNLDNLVLTSDQNLNAVGNALENRITGNSGNNMLSGAAGNDVMFGGAGNDSLDGGLGNDVMFGGKGNDTFIVNSVSDKVTEFGDEGVDAVESSLSYTLNANLENLTLTGATAISGTGNALDNKIIGNAKANILIGGAGNDTLNGGAGNDSLVGGIGNDTYVLDSVGDKVTELIGEGVDTVIASFNYALADNFENLTLTGAKNIDADGNDEGNIILGNSGNNVLDGGEGNDSLSGGAGDDILLGGDGDDTLDGGTGADILAGGDGNNSYITDGNDTVIGGAGVDTVLSSGSIVLSSGIENLTLTNVENVNATGNNLDNVIIGNAGDNVLNGADGADLIEGNEGNDTFITSAGEDTLNGGAGNDTFVIGAELEDGAVIDGGVDDETTGDQAVNVVYYTGTIFLLHQQH